MSQHITDSDLFLRRGLSGLVLLRLRLLTLISFVEVLSLPGVWFLGGGVLCFRVVRLGGHSNAADAHDAADVFLYRDSSIAPLLDMERRFKAVMVFLTP